MDKKLIDIFENREDNYLMPFYWQKGNHSDKIPEQMEEIYQSGCKAVCIESRTHENFGKKEWYNDLRIIIKEAKKRDMKVWILDDDHFPSGHAGGLVDSHPHLKKLHLIEHHIDVCGPKNNMSVLIKHYMPDDEVVGAYMYARTDGINGIDTENYIDLSDNVKGDFVYFDVPDGFYRVFIILKSHYGANDHIDMLNSESTDLMIKGIYEPHYNELQEYFGSTVAGFFSDEPGFYTEHFGWGLKTGGFYGCTVGQQSVCLPISDDVINIMSEKNGEDIRPFLVGLWFNIGDKTGPLRHSYMYTISKIYSRNYTMKLGNWCREHGVMYIGHIIEDNNCHSRLGGSAAHYFRSQHGQDMSGMDIVFQQVMPGFSHYAVNSAAAGEYIDSEFFHYVLPKMCSSDSHFDKQKNGKAMCEVFGAAGWAEGTPMQKWLIDFLLVRGINRFVPHAFSPDFPNFDCPPHFGAGGFDPQFDGFSALMKYTNKASHLLSDGVHIASCAVLYHGDGEWGSDGDYMLTQVPCKNLYDNNIDYDIISIDYLKNASVFNNKLRINRETYDCLFVPYAAYLSFKNLKVLENLESAGFDVVFVNSLPKNENRKFKIIRSDECAKYYTKNYKPDVVVKGAASLLRHYHIKRGSTDVYMFFNESLTESVDARVGVGKNDVYLKLDLLNDDNCIGVCENGEFGIKLSPYQSAIYVFDKFDDLFLSCFSGEKSYSLNRELRLPFEISLSEECGFENYEKLMISDRPVNITSAEIRPDFSGKIKYSGRFLIDEEGEYALDLGDVGENARIILNGSDVGIRICKPYVFDISKQAVVGENDIEIIVSNTLAQRIKDELSTYIALPPSGLASTMKLYRIIR